MKLTLRELFLLVALVAIGCGWWVDRNRYVNWYVPQIRVQESVDIGVVAPNEIGTCEFKVENIGRVPVFAAEGPCSNGLSYIRAYTPLQAGEIDSVLLKWQAGRASGPFTVTAKLYTNDPAQHKLLLTVAGSVAPLAHDRESLRAAEATNEHESL